MLRPGPRRPDRSGFVYGYSVYQVEYSRNLIFTSGAVMERLFDTIVDRTRTRLDVPKLRTLFGVGHRPHRGAGADLSPREAVVVEKPQWNLTIFKVHFGLLTLKGYTKGEHVLRFEAIVHNTRALGCGRVLERLPEIVTRLAGMVDRFTGMLDCVDVGFLPDGLLDFGLLTLKGYTKGEHVLRFEAIVHNTRALGCGRVLERFPEIVTRLAGMVDRFTGMLDCVDVGFLPDGLLDELPRPTQIGATRVGGVDVNKTRIRAVLAAALALAVAPEGFTVAQLAAKVQTMTGQTNEQYSTRQAAYDLRKIRGKQLVVKPGRTRRYHVPPDAARAIAALTVLRDHVVAPILAGVRTPRRGRKPATWTRIDDDYQTLRLDMQTLFHDLGVAA